MRSELRLILAAGLAAGFVRCGGDKATGPPGPPAQILVFTGNAQQGEVGLALPAPVTVVVRDGAGRAVPNASVTWIVLAGGGSVSVPTSVTDQDGHASVTWVLGNTAGAAAHTLRAGIGTSSASVDFTASGVLSAGQLGVQSGDGQIGAAAAPLPAPIAVFVKTLAGTPVVGVTVSWQVTSGGGNVSLAASKTDGQGVARVSWTLGGGGGSNTAAAAVSELTPATVAFSARGLVAPASTITGAITTTNGFLAPPISTGAFPSAWAPSVVRSAGEQGRADAGARPLQFPRGAGTPQYTPNDLIVTFRAAALAAPPLGSRALASAGMARTVAASVWKRAAAWEASGRMKVTAVSPAVLAARVRVADPAQLDAVAAALRRDPDVARVTRDQWLRAHGRAAAVQTAGGTIPNDPNYPNQSWHYVMIDLPRAWSITTGSPSVLVAVVDNGIRFDHPALAANLTRDGYDFVSMASDSLCFGGHIDNAGDGDGYDPDPTIPDDWDLNPAGTCLQQRSPAGGHGLHVAGTIGAVGNDGVGVTGVNWSVSIRPVRVLGPAGGTSFDVAQGILYAAGLPASDGGAGSVQAPSAARIINLSLGGPCDFGAEVMHDAVIAATNAGALVVASAGNDASSTPSCPAAYPEVLSVTAVGPNGQRASYANFGPTVDIAAPGGDFPAGADGTFGVFSTTCDFTANPCTPNQARYFGTSMAAPHVSGVAALLLAVTPSLTVEELRSRLTSYAADGIVNARNSLTQTLAPPVQRYVRVFDAGTGQAVATQPVGANGVFTVSGLADGSYYVFAGEDENGDAQIGVPGRRWGALGGTATPRALTVTSSAGATAFFSVGFANEVEPNQTPPTTYNHLLVGGYLHGALGTTDADVYRVDIPAAGQYSFETSGWDGAFCKFALNVNTVMVLYDANGGVLAQNDDADSVNNNFCSRISTALAAGTYFVGVTPGLDFAGATHKGRYRVEARAGP